MAANQSYCSHSMHGGMNHLAGYGAFPDQIVEFLLILAEKLSYFNGLTCSRSGANSFVRFLGIFGLGLKYPDTVR